jgi:hypothetical protein
VTDYVFYPVTGNGLTSGTAYTWNLGTINFATPADWTSVTSFSTLTIGGTVTTGTVPGNGANVGLIGGAIDPVAFSFYTPNPTNGDPFIASNDYPVNVLLNSGSVALGNMVLAGFNQYANILGGNAPVQVPTLDVEGATLTVSGNILDTASVTFPPINLGFFGTISSAVATGGGTIDLGQGASIDVAGNVAPAINFHFNDGSGNILEIDGDSKLTPTAFAGTITGYVPGDTILLPNVPSNVSGVATTGSYDITTGVLSITVGDPVTIDLNIPGFASSSGPVALTSVGNGIEVVVCFLAGTRLATVSGEVPVEELAVDDQVRTASGRIRPIVWIGTGRVMAARGRRSAATPVIVRKSALADNVPARDLRVTKGHSLLIDDVLIPVEFLVNHRTILWDDQASGVTIYHIELETHDVLVANGAPAESYRDDGNRWLFQNANPGWTLPPQAPCAPVLTGGPVVDGIWRRLLDRAGPRRGVPLTDDPDLHLWVDGKRIDPLERTVERCAFRLPPRPRSVRIRSRSAVPQELGVARDDRCLGVSVRRIVLAQARRQQALDAEAAALVEGWHRFEPEDALRWTDGDAAVPASIFAGMTGAGMLIVQMGATTQYIDDGTAKRAA